MQESKLINEIKLLEIKLLALKAQLRANKSKIKPYTAKNLYGILQGSEDITAEDIEAVKMKFKEPLS